MDLVSPELPPLFGLNTLAGVGEEDDYDEAIVCLLKEEGEEHKDDAVLPPNISRPCSVLSDRSPSPVQVTLNLVPEGSGKTLY